MSRLYEADKDSITVIDVLKDFARKVVAYGVEKGLDTSGLKIRIAADVGRVSGIDSILTVSCEDVDYHIPVIFDDSINQVDFGDGTFESDVYIGNPEWDVGNACGSITAID